MLSLQNLVKVMRHLVVCFQSSVLHGVSWCYDSPSNNRSSMISWSGVMQWWKSGVCQAPMSGAGAELGSWELEGLLLWLSASEGALAWFVPYRTKDLAVFALSDPTSWSTFGWNLPLKYFLLFFIGFRSYFILVNVHKCISKIQKLKKCFNICYSG